MAAVGALTLLGLVLELWGLWLVILSVRADMSAAIEVAATEPSDLRLAVRKDLQAEWDIEGEPSPEERLHRLETLVNNLEKREAERREEVQTYVNEKVSHIEHASVERDKALREFLATRLKGDRRQRLLGVGLFALGAICSSVANLLGALT